jgi:hypothetical protein
MADSTNKMTLTAWAYKRISRGRTASGYWLEIGKAGPADDGETRVYLDRTPIGGWTGAVRLRPIGAGPPKLPAPKPLRPQSDDEDAEDE